MSDERIRFIEPAEQSALSPADARRRRGKAMTGFGVAALIWGVLALSGGSPFAFVLILLGVALLVGGLIVQP